MSDIARMITITPESGPSFEVQASQIIKLQAKGSKCKVHYKDEQGVGHIIVVNESRTDLKNLINTEALVVADSETYDPGVQATPGGDQSDGYPIVKGRTHFTDVATNGDSATLDLATPGKKRTIQNRGAATLKVYPAVGDNIDAGAVDAGVDVAAGNDLVLFCYDEGTWIS